VILLAVPPLLGAMQLAENLDQPVPSQGYDRTFKTMESIQREEKKQRRASLWMP
jgi:hypothetical protein